MAETISPQIASALKTTRDEGIEEGKREKALEIAKRLLQQEMSLDLVCEVTGLNEKIVGELAEAFKKALL